MPTSPIYNVIVCIPVRIIDGMALYFKSKYWFALFLQGIICYNVRMSASVVFARGGTEWKLYD